MVKFLIIRFSSIGDIVLTTPVVRGLKQQVEESEVHYLTKKQFLPAIKANPYIDQIHVFDDNLGKVIRILRKQNFDYIIDLHRNLRSFRVKNSLRRFSFSFQKLNREKWLMVNLKINRLPEKHIVQRYLETVTHFSVEEDGKGLDYFVAPEDEWDFRQDYPLLRKPFWVAVVGGGHATKQIPAEKLAMLINSIDVPVVLLGGPDDTNKSEQIMGLCPGRPLIDLTGKINLNRSAYLVKHCRLILTPDTGLMHIAAAFKKTVFSVWGNTIPQFGMFPYHADGASRIYEVEGLKCRPCSKIGYEQCPRKHFRCMVDQSWENIRDAIKEMVSAGEKKADGLAGADRV